MGHDHSSQVALTRRRWSRAGGVGGGWYRKEETAFSTYPEKKAAGTITRRGPALKGFLCPIVAQSPINAFRTVKRPDGALKSGLKRAPFAIAFYNVYRRDRMYVSTSCMFLPLTLDADTPVRLYSYSLCPCLAAFSLLKHENVRRNFKQYSWTKYVLLGLILINETETFVHAF